MIYQYTQLVITEEAHLQDHAVHEVLNHQEALQHHLVAKKHQHRRQHHRLSSKEEMCQSQSVYI